MPITVRTKDSLLKAFDVGELAGMSHGIHVPPDATAHTEVDLRRRREKFVSWLYDHDYGWTPGKEHAFPRPPLQSPPYFIGTFPLHVSTLAKARHNYVVIDLRPFPRQARVFAVVPTKLLPVKVAKKAVAGSAVMVGTSARVVRNTKDFNLIFGRREKVPANARRVIVELTRGSKATLDDLRLTTSLETIELDYGVLREYVKPKTYYCINFMQFIDYRLMGRFSHIYQAYHQYDVPIVGDKRTKIAYRRSSREVSKIPAMALAYFDSWYHAHEAGYDFGPRSFARHYTPSMVSDVVAKKILTFFNNPRLSAKRIVDTIVDNPYVDAAGRPEKVPTVRRGIDPATAKRILTARAKAKTKIPLRQKSKSRKPIFKTVKGFSSLEQIDAVKGVDPDTMSDVITTFLERHIALAERIAARRKGWLPSRAVIKALRSVPTRSRARS